VEYQGQGMYTNWIGDASLISSGLRSSPNHKVWRKEEMDLHKCTGFSPALFVSISSRYRLFIFDLWSEAGCLEKGETQNFSSSLFACYSCLCILDSWIWCVCVRVCACVRACVRAKLKGIASVSNLLCSNIWNLCWFGYAKSSCKPY